MNRLASKQVVQVYNYIEANPEVVTHKTSQEAAMLISQEMGYVVPRTMVQSAAKDHGLKFMRARNTTEQVAEIQANTDMIKVLAKTLYVAMGADAEHLKLIVTGGEQTEVWRLMGEWIDDRVRQGKL